MSSVSALRAALRAVAEARAAVLGPAGELAAQRAAFEALPSVQALTAQVAQLRTAAAEAEGHARAALEHHYTETKDKTPCGKAGVVKLFTEYTYKPELAMEWSRVHAPLLVSEAFDESGFKKLISAGIGFPVPAFVTSREVPKAQIAAQINPADLVEPTEPTEVTS